MLMIIYKKMKLKIKTIYFKLLNFLNKKMINQMNLNGMIYWNKNKKFNS